MHRLVRLLIVTLAAFVCALGAGASSAAAGWAETERIGGLTALTLHPGPANPTGARVPSLPREITSSNAAKLTAKTSTPAPVRMDVDGAGNIYVLVQGPAVPIEGPPTVNGAAITADGFPGCPSYLGFDVPGYLYVASLVSVYRVEAGTHDVTWLGTWLSQSEAGAPAAVNAGADTSPLFEGGDPPAGLAVDRTPGSERLYVSVPGEGILRRDLGGAGAAWSAFVEDDHDVWLPYENSAGFGGDPFSPETAEYPLGEGVFSVVPCLRGGGTPQQAVDAAYGTLWEGGPSVPGTLAVDPVTREVVAAEQAPQGANGLPESVDRISYEPLRLRRFSPAGEPLADVDVAGAPFDPTGEIYTQPAVFGQSIAPTLLGRGGTDETLDSRVGGMAFDRAGNLHVLNQIDDKLGQVFRTARSGARVHADAVFRAGPARPFGPVSSPARRGIEDLAVRPLAGDQYRYLVSTTSGPGLLELKSDGEPNGTIGAALDPSDPAKPCTFDNARIRLAVDSRDGSVLVMRQPSGGASPVILRLDPGAAAANCATTTPPEEVEPTDPALSVVGARYKGEGVVEPLEGHEFTFSPLSAGHTVELDDADASAGWLFSVRVTDDDNTGSDFAAGARCVLRTTLPSGPVTRTFELRGGACRPAADTASIQGAPGSAANGPFTITKNALRDPGTGEGRAADVEITITDDEGVSRSTTFRVQLKTAVRVPLEITRFDASGVGGGRSLTYRFNHVASGLEEWQLDFGGDDVSPRRLPADGWSSAVLPGQSPEVTYPGPGTYVAILRVRRGAGTPSEEQVERRVTVLLSAETRREPALVPVESGAACETPLGIPLAQLGLGDPQLCVPADPCDVNTQALGLTRLPIVRPDSCAGSDAELFASTSEAANAALPQASRPTVISSSLRLGRDRRISVRVRCGTGPTSCGGRVRIALAGGGSPRSIGSVSFAGLRPQSHRTVRVRASAGTARRLHRGKSRMVNVAMAATAPAGFVAPQAKTKRLRLAVGPTRSARR